MRHYAAALSILCVGCARPECVYEMRAEAGKAYLTSVWDMYALPPEVVLDTDQWDCPPGMLEAAVEMWRTGPVPKFVVSYGPYMAGIAADYGTIHVRSYRDADKATFDPRGWLGVTRNVTIDIDGVTYLQASEIVIKACTVRTIAHELGHALGLEHSEDINDVMYPYDEPTATTLSADTLRLTDYHCGG